MKSDPSVLTTKTYDWAMCLIEIESKENSNLPNLVRNCPFTIVEQTDERGFTLMHHAVLSCVVGKVQTLVLLAK